MTTTAVRKRSCCRCTTITVTYTIAAAIVFVGFALVALFVKEVDIATAYIAGVVAISGTIIKAGQYVDGKEAKATAAEEIKELKLKVEKHRRDLQAVVSKFTEASSADTLEHLSRDDLVSFVQQLKEAKAELIKHDCHSMDQVADYVKQLELTSTRTAANDRKIRNMLAEKDSKIYMLQSRLNHTISKLREAEYELRKEKDSCKDSTALQEQQITTLGKALEERTHQVQALMSVIVFLEDKRRASFGNLVQLLNDERINIHCRNRIGRCALHLAAASGNLTIVEAFLNIPEVDVNLHDGNEDTPLHFAAGYGRTEVVKTLLLNDRIEANPRGSENETPLHLAAGKGRQGAVATLLDNNKVENNPRNDNEETPLHSAASAGHPEVVAMLLRNKEVEVNPRDSKGLTPLHHAAFEGHQEVVRTLLRHNQVEKNPRDHTGRTPLHFAASNGRQEVVARLLRNDRVEVNPHEEEGRTPLALAVAHENQAVIDLMQRHSRGCVM